MVVYVLALGCPTLQSGTSLPNTPIWHAVAQHLDMVLDRHMGAQHVFRSTCLYISSNLAGRAHTGCDTLWHLLFIRHRLLSGGHMLYHMDILYSVYNVIHYIPCSGTLLLFGCEFLGTPVDPDLSMFHSTFTSSLHYLSAPDVMSWHYRITCYSSSQQLMILLVSIHRYVEPFVIRWLYGTPACAMISVMMTLCIILTSELLYLRTCTVVVRCALRGTLLRCPVLHPCTVIMMLFLSGALLYCRYVGAAFLISMDIVICIRCWLYWTMLWYWYDEFYYCRSWTLHTWLVNYADDCYTMSWWCLLRRCCWCCLPSPFRPATSLSSRWWFAVFVRQSSFVLMNIYYADDGSLVSSPWWPSELDKQFVSARWTLEDDDDPASSLPDSTWLNFVYCNHYCIIVSEHPVCLSVCHYNICGEVPFKHPRCGPIIWMLYLLSIYLCI